MEGGMEGGKEKCERGRDERCEWEEIEKEETGQEEIIAKEHGDEGGKWQENGGSDEGSGRDREEMGKEIQKKKGRKEEGETNTLNNDVIISYSLPDCTSEVLHESL